MDVGANCRHLLRHCSGADRERFLGAFNSEVGRKGSNCHLLGQMAAYHASAMDAEFRATREERAEGGKDESEDVPESVRGQSEGIKK